MATALDNMHAKVLDASTSKRQKNHERRSKKKDVEIAQFDVANFVLYVDVWSISHSKLSVTWPHSNRLKFYADDPLDVTEELLRHIAHNADSHVVDQFLDCRYNDRLAVFEVCVRWRGLQEIEASWEPAANLLENIPTEFKHYVRSNKIPQDVNAYYSPHQNLIVFPVAVLQRPIFDAQFDAAQIFGVIGVGIGHKITHGFDNHGRNVDGDGNLNPWWSNATRTAFETKTQCFIDQYDKFEERTDNGGLKTSFRAYHEYLKKFPSQYTEEAGDKLFYLSFAQTSCSKNTDGNL
ncbi:hypothetical protein H257_16396 [Aphanomyces astaci]|uniref:Chromo domain-containing protein n=1 Tax=Aphanomyces astaci TaxID=112090 RepID=W4FKM1_APHAT|nr:hypothetical protein H257_16396 [Aphanomyces astaci]ETV67421.1 hypothetical protein H257_16396 [Aphanomyces astaci]|eukprot:XP_009843112.1 hypothetical protein H257_16396 [Aphanomyces astaci]